MTAGRVAGKVALVTGAARGQGRSHAVRLAEEGADVIVVDLCEPVETVDYPMPGADDLAETADMVRRLGREVVACQADVRDLDALRGAVDDSVARFGRLDIVCANAGIVSAGQTHELSEQAWDQMIDINLSGVWRTCKVAIPHLIAGQRGGSVILTSSVSGIRSYEGLAHYVAAKHGVVGLMKTMAQELAKHRIRVNTVNPTQVDTAMVQNEAMYRLFCPGIENPTREDFAAVSRNTILMPIDWVESIDVSNAVLFLASDEARYITGVALPIDGGACVL